MVLVDTSTWVTHLRHGSRVLEALLNEAQVACHPFIVGELACGNIRNRNRFLNLLQSLPMAPTVTSEELLYFIDRHRLMGLGIGFVDVHLLASARLCKMPLWTSDQKLHATAQKIKAAYQ